MEFTASHRFAQITPRKARLVADLIRGQKASEALRILDTTRRRASAFIKKVLKAAAAAADEREGLDPQDLTVERIWIDGGPSRRTIWARPRGMWAFKLHRTSHIHVVLSDEGAEEEDQDAEAEA